MDLITSPPFKPRRRDPCFCGSGNAFKDCCGSAASDRRPPHGVHIIPNALDQKTCARILEYGDNSRKEWVGTVDSETGEVGGREDDSRVTKQTLFDDKKQRFIDKTIQQLWVKVVEPALNIKLDWYEQPVLLHYADGGHYAPHADAEYFDAVNQRWCRQMDRDLSLLVYINDDFDGGKLLFNHFNYHYTPKKGDLVVFPSDHRYMHQAQRVTRGQRYCIVSWSAVSGRPRANPAPPFNALTIKRRRFSLPWH